MKYRSILPLALLTPAITLASDLSYQYAGIATASGQSTVDSIDIDLAGIAVGASFELSDKTFASVTLGRLVGETAISSNAVRTEGNSIGLDIGFHHPISQNTDIVLSAGVSRTGTTTYVNGKHFDSDSSTSTGLDFDVRSMISQNVEVNAGVSNSYSDGESDTSMSVGAGINFGNNNQIGFGYSFDEDTYIYGLEVLFGI